ncbi:DUF969 domain-containing protein [Luteolibacter ambystomatis]|uniref:DUF969 domain-containing protein n=1 Tax=Luteolibacter ambystomatis TaxID=2824561 RepID=A0A975J153_9BACT|nr:DUF969 domain-containing protein [Luteolibacter ambystomatis]QUE52116.1 DUF969 domain-containing protein [Luteolibacter ambystomatis]
MMWLKLIGIPVVAIGFALRLNTLLVVMAAGIATGLAAGMTFNEVLELFGRLFIENRYMTLPVILIAPVIGLLERHGLRERAETLIRRARGATAGRVIFLYSLVRQISIALGVNIGGHAGAVRPIIAPMAEGAAHAQHGPLPDETRDTIRAHAAAAENIGNFFGEDVFIAVGAVLLMKGVFDAQHIEVGVWPLALWGIPTAIAASFIMAWRTRVLDRRIRRETNATQGKEEA